MAVGRLKLRLDVGVVLFAVIFINCVVQSQYFLEQPKHIYIVEQEGDPDSILARSQEQEDAVESQGIGAQESQFMSRKGEAASSSEAKADNDDEEEDDDDEDASVEEETHQRLKGRPKPIRLPSNFDDVLKKTMQLAKRQRRPLHGDPSPIHKANSLLRRDGGDDDDRGKPETRLLWPLSLEISKGGINKGIGPVHFGSYTEWAADAHEGGGGGGGGGHGGWGSYDKHPYNHGGWGEDEDDHRKGLSDKKILKSAHYKKYRKKKKHIIKKLKKKLKFKRLIQKILQKHISYLDKIAPY